MRRRLLVLASLVLCALAAACTDVTVTPIGTDPGVSPQAVPPGGAAAPLDAGSGAQLSLLQQTGEGPIIQFVAGATHTLDCEIYLVTDRDLAGALGAAAARGVRVRMMLESRAGSTALVKGQPGVQVLPVPHVTLDHSKTCVRDAGTPAAAVLVGTANWSASASTKNVDMVLTLPGAEPAAQQITQVVEADAAKATAPAPPQTLAPGTAVISPFNSRALIDAFLSQQGDRLLVTSEELRDPAEIAAITRAAGAHRVDVAAPDTEKTPAGANRCESQLYMHGKVMVLWRGGQPALAFLGSENLSTQSLDRNREMGVIEGPAVANAIWTALQAVLTCPS